MYPSENDPHSDGGFIAALGSIVALILLMSCGAKNAPPKQSQEEKRPDPVVQTTNQPLSQKQIYSSLFVAER